MAKQKSGSKKKQAAVQHPLTVSREELLDETGDGHFRTLLHDLLAYATRLEAVRAGFGKIIGLTGIEYTMLVAVCHLSEKHPIHVNKLAEHLHLSGAFVTIQTNKLEKKGLIQKRKDKADARKVELVATDKARGLLTELSPTQSQVNDVMFGSLSRDEFHDLADIVSRMLDDSDKAVALVNYLSQSSLVANN